MKRRDFLKTVAGGIAVGGNGIMTRSALAYPVSTGPSGLSIGTPEASVLEALPGKKPLIKRSFRPPNLETPVKYFRELYTPNEAFFVRYHLADIPKIDAQTWKLKIGGDAVEKPREFTIDELKSGFELVEIAAVSQCAGNRRGLFQPPVAGIQWGNGAMGNAQWRGIRLKDLLNRAGIKKNALEVVMDGTDAGAIAETPDFSKSIPLWKALDEDTLIAFEMNGEPLPHWHGHPARLVVPGWTATYWVKHLGSINVMSRPHDGYWMKTAYRLPAGLFPKLGAFTSQETEASVPITEMAVNSLVTNLEDGQRYDLGQWIEINGIAWDGGHGIERVEVSIDAGKSWRRAVLEDDHGRYSWRQWHFRFLPAEKGSYSLLIKAANGIGAAQPMQLIQNPSGYHHHRVQRLDFLIV